jgi:hypothetical protein
MGKEFAVPFQRGRINWPIAETSTRFIKQRLAHRNLLRHGGVRVDDLTELAPDALELGEERLVTVALVGGRLQFRPFGCKGR